MEQENEADATFVPTNSPHFLVCTTMSLTTRYCHIRVLTKLKIVHISESRLPLCLVKKNILYKTTVSSVSCQKESSSIHVRCASKHRILAFDLVRVGERHSAEK